MSPMAERPGIMFYFELRPALSMLSDEEAGKLFKAAMEYGEFGVVPELDGMAAMAWTFVRPKIDRDNEAYNERCIQNAFNRYVGECKKNGTTALSREAWEAKIFAPRQQRLTSVNDGSSPSPTTTGTGTTATTTTTEGTPAVAETTTIASKSKRKGTGAGKGVRGETADRDDNSRRNAALDMLDQYMKM